MGAWTMLASALGRARRVPRAGFTRLTTKQGPRGYYKGKGAAPTGQHTSLGRYIPREAKMPEYVVPDLTGFKLKAFIATNTIKPAT